MQMFRDKVCSFGKFSQNYKKQKKYANNFKKYQKILHTIYEQSDNNANCSKIQERRTIG